MEGAADWAATIIFAIVGLSVAWYVLGWLAEKAIALIDWLTRHE